MKEKNLDITILLDFYGDVLTEKQRQVVELYYDEDLSLAEISELTGITRQGVRDSIKRGEAVLFEMEEKLGLSARFSRMREDLEEIVRGAREIEEYGERCCSPKLMSCAKSILSAAQKLIDGDN